MPSSDIGKSLDLTSASWAPGEYDRYMSAQGVDRTKAGTARGTHGAVTVAYSGYAARVGLEALKQGGGAIDAALTAAMVQIALMAGAPISYFGIMSLVYFDAKAGTTHTMNAEWNTIRGETDPMSIPGAINFSSKAALRGMGEPSGRTVLVGGFLKGVEASHRRFGKLPFHALFQPSIEIAENGMPVTRLLDEMFSLRGEELARLPETRKVFLKPDGSTYKPGEIFCQPQLAETLRRIAAEGTDYIYGGAWGEKLVAAVQADGGKMTIQDLEAYEPIWSDPLVADIGRGYAVATSPWPNSGGVALIEAQNLADAAGLPHDPHWTEDPEALRKALDISMNVMFMFYPPELLAQAFPGIDFSPASRVTREHAKKLWPLLANGNPLARWKRTMPMHSDDVVAIDAEGNIATITQSINCVFWGKTAINIDGISIGDPASYQQAAISRIEPGSRMPAPTETGIVFKDDVPVLGFASMGAGLHQRTFQCLLNYTAFGMNVEAAINTADFYLPKTDVQTGEMTIAVPEGRFDHALLDATGYQWTEINLAEARLSGEGKWVAIERDPQTGMLHAASHNRNNSDAVAF